MNTHDNMIVGVHTQARINRFKEYLLSAKLTASVTLQDDMLFVEFEDQNRPNDKQLQTIQDIFYWSDKIVVPSIDSLVHFYDHSNTLLVNLKNYEEIISVYFKLKGFRAIVKSFSCTSNDFSFDYDFSGRSPFNYAELIEFEKIVNPKETTSTKHISVFRITEFYSMTVKVSI